MQKLTFLLILRYRDLRYISHYAHVVSRNLAAGISKLDESNDYFVYQISTVNFYAPPSPSITIFNGYQIAFQRNVASRYSRTVIV